MALIRSSQNAVAQHAIILDALDVKAAQLQSHEADFHRALPVILPSPLNQKQIESENTRVDF